MKASIVFALVLLAGIAAGQQSNNHYLHAVPTPGKVSIDGSLDDWDLSGTIESFAHIRMKNTYSAKVAAMHDAENFYLAIVWRDPTPMFNMNDSRFDIGFGWRSDCVQLRVRTDMVMHVDCWYSTAADHPVVNICYGQFNQSPESSGNFTHISDAITVGVKEAFRKGEDGRSYTQEIALPWKLITGQSAIVKATGKPWKEPKTCKAGDTFDLGMEFLWGGPDGKTWPVHRYADLLKEGKSSREFFWTAHDAWGTVILEPKGKLDLPKPDYGEGNFLQKTEGPAAIEYTMPFDGYATIVIEDARGSEAAGIRVRNLIGMAPRSKGKQTDYWDGTDEAGRIAPPGTYAWRGLIHQGIDPIYEATYGTPGTPPWDNADNTGAWLSDHVAPRSVAAGKDVMVLAAVMSEAGWAMIGTNNDGKKLWGVRKFERIRAVAADDQFAYVGLEADRQHALPSVGRVELKTGAYAPYETPQPVLMVDVATADEKANLAGIAVNGDRLAVSLTGLNVVRFLDRKSAKPLGDVPVAEPGGLAFDAAGTLFAISGSKIVKIADNKVAEFIAGGLGKPYDLAVDAQGRAFVFVSDRASNQVKVFDKAGKLVRAIGAEGGRTKPAKWNPNAIGNIAGLDVDAAGRIWVAEETMWPKRVSVWEADGKLVTEFIGPTTYGGMGAFVDPDDKTRVFGNACEWKLDYRKNKATVIANCLADLVPGDLVKYKGREYVMGKRGLLFIRRGDVFAPCVQFGTIRNKNEFDQAKLPLAEPGQFPLNFTWSDLNDDGSMQPEEFVTRPASQGWNAGYWGGYWLDDQLNIVTCPGNYNHDTVQRIPVKGWTKGGVPIYDVDKIETWLDRDRPGGGPNKLFLVDRGTAIFGSKPIAAVRPDGTVVWTWQDNWPDVHGSHNAPIPENDSVLVGVLSCIGRAATGNPAIGSLWAMNSNMGRLYIMTTDGLLVGSIFQDTRIGADPWPAEAKAGIPIGGTSMGSEWFGGYFFKAAKTNEYYLIAGGTSYNLIKLNGLDTLQPLKGGRLEFTGKDVLAAEAVQQKAAAKKAEKKSLAILLLGKGPVADGRLDEFPKESFAEWSSGGYRVRAAVATDGASLCLAYDVSGDTNPMVNGGQDVTQLFVTGDSVDLQLGTNPEAKPDRTGPVVGDLRLLISVLAGKPVAVLYRWKAQGKKNPQIFRCPWRSAAVDWVEELEDASISINRRGDGYVVEAMVPLKTLGFDPKPGKEYKLDLGVIFSDAKGNNRAARVYWANKATGLVADVPGEIMAQPNLWGTAAIKE